MRRKIWFLPVDKAAFKGDIPEICNMVPFEPFDFYIKRKLYIHNMGHATCAYLGDLLGLQYIYESINVHDIFVIVQNAMLESAIALSKEYGVNLIDIQLHITDLLCRFGNEALKDTCSRVGGDPSRKLSPDDRLIGSSNLAVKNNIIPAYISVGVAAGLVRYINETEGMEQSEISALKVLKEVSKLDTKGKLASIIIEYYKMILNGCSISDLCKKAHSVKHSELQNVI